MPDQFIWVMGLSIDEDLRWAAVQIPKPQPGRWKEEDEAYISGTHHWESLCALPDTKNPQDLHKLIREKLKRMQRKYPDIFAAAMAVGVSTVGIVDVSGRRLLNIDRKNWKYHGTASKYLVDFKELFAEIFDGRSVKLSVQNDAIAKCLAEYKQQHLATDIRPVQNLCYAMFHDGVNGGIVRGYGESGKPLLSLRHHEIGHVFPAPHPADIRFDPRNSGCKVHDCCFVALGSGARVRKQWGVSLEQLKHSNETPHPWEILVHYIVQFCWTLFLTIPTDRILLGGSMIFEELLQPVREAFNRLNTYHGRRYIDAPVLDEYFISMASLSADEASLIGALELARSEIGGRLKAVV